MNFLISNRSWITLIILLSVLETRGVKSEFPAVKCRPKDLMSHFRMKVAGVSFGGLLSLPRGIRKGKGVDGIMGRSAIVYPQPISHICALRYFTLMPSPRYRSQVTLLR